MQNWTESENSSLIQSSESVAECLSDREKFKEMSDRCDFVSMRADCLGKTENSQKTSNKINTLLLLALLCAAGVIASLVVASVWFVLTKKRHSADESQSKKKVYFWVCFHYYFYTKKRGKVSSKIHLKLLYYL